jgi:Recombination endonuclease VII
MDNVGEDNVDNVDLEDNVNVNVDAGEIIDEIEVIEKIEIEYIQLRQKDIPVYRERIAEEQNFVCAICIGPLVSGASLDHQHKTKAETIGVNGAGLIRGVLCRDCNVFEGKIWNNSKRFGKFDDLPQFLRNLADYLEKDNYPYIHPREAPQVQKVSKRQYNKLVKAYSDQTALKAKLPPFPGKRKPSQKLLSLFTRFNISPYILKDNE